MSIIRVCLVLFGSLLIAIGILFFVISEKGADPISTFLLGILNFAPISIGLASQIFNLGVLVVIFMLDRRHLGAGSILNAFFIGLFVNICTPFVIFIADYTHIAVQILFGPLLIGVGSGIYMSAKLGSGAIEGLMLYLADKLIISIKVSRMLLDGVLVFIGIALGSAWGIGSVLGIALIGPIIAVTIKILNKVLYL